MEMQIIEDTGQAAIRDDPPRLDDTTATVDVPPAEGEETPLAHRVTKKPKPSVQLLNRAQRRAIAKYIKHKAKRQMKRLFKLSHAARMAQVEQDEQRRMRCGTCGLPFVGIHLASTLLQCQCKVTTRNAE